MGAGLLLRAACAALLLLPPRVPGRGPSERTQPRPFAAERRRLGPHVCLSSFGSGCCPGWMPSVGSGHCTLPLCSFGCGSGICVAPNVCSCKDGEQGATCPDAHSPCGEYGCDLACNHGGCREVARVCPVGFSMTETAVGVRCTDIDECLSSSCEGRCVNTEGGFVCECGPGMQLAADRHSCQDMDECLQTPCQQRCRNSVGSYKCSCRAGFHLHGNRHSCVDVNECQRPPERRVCHHACHNTVGSFLCTCRPGFRLRADHKSCEALPKALSGPSAILQPRPPGMALLLPEAGRPGLSPGHSPPPGAPGPLAVVRATRPPAPAWLPSTPMATPVPAATLLGTLGPPFLLHGGALATPSSPPGPKDRSLPPGPSPCWHLGVTYASGSRWAKPGCRQCWCEDGEVTCGEVRCEATCSHPAPPEEGRCCPSCTGCFHSGAVRAEGAVFSPPGKNCTVCACVAGNVSCIYPECPPGPCEVASPSDCCTCVPVRCFFHGHWYTEGAVFSGAGDDCTTCVCQHGEVTCSFTPCPELDCPRQEWRLGPGQCCFACREPTARSGCSLDDNGAEFPVGQIWSPGDPCELCICQADGSVSCRRTDCVDSCPHPIRIPGQCCPDCSAGCTYTGQVFYNNETFPSTLDPCLSCICLLGSVACSPVDCPITCTYPFHPDGECCPVCLDCNYEGRKVANGQVFTLEDEPCTRCTCQLGEVSCERAPCPPACAQPTLPTPAGHCCASASCPGSPSLLDEKPGMSSAGAARSPHGHTEAPGTCSSCPGRPPAARPRPVLPLRQLLFGANASRLLPERTGRQEAWASPQWEAGGPFPGAPGSSPAPPASSLPPAPPGHPRPASGPTLLAEALPSLVTVPSPARTPATAPGLSEATPPPSSQQPSTGTPGRKSPPSEAPLA
ncbi:von Willebrand factor C and EGF domain-containing protein isoform X3 [Heterocephalus glaber]|uniref:von Willebrand factor C and EGF domain-containing protein isoform X3 n=1 Tax=Heterocephalus glaber TaxID=10181 RepID=A0AAX6QHK1_HETGA|nr:von Willebrand factor C and EGF domain-containing protein isoform X3 [Heterocephalus glaber]